MIDDPMISRLYCWQSRDTDCLHFNVKCNTLDAGWSLHLRESPTISLHQHCHYPEPQSTAALNNCQSLKPCFHSANGKKFMKTSLLYIIWYFTFSPLKTNTPLNAHTNSVPVWQRINVYCKNQTKYINTLCGKMKFLNITVGGTYSYQWT